MWPRARRRAASCCQGAPWPEAFKETPDLSGEVDAQVGRWRAAVGPRMFQRARERGHAQIDLWLHGGYTVVTRWLHGGYTVVTRGYTVIQRDLLRGAVGVARGGPGARVGEEGEVGVGESLVYGARGVGQSRRVFEEVALQKGGDSGEVVEGCGDVRQEDVRFVTKVGEHLMAHFSHELRSRRLSTLKHVRIPARVEAALVVDVQPPPCVTGKPPHERVHALRIRVVAISEHQIYRMMRARKISSGSATEATHRARRARIRRVHEVSDVCTRDYPFTPVEMSGRCRGDMGAAGDRHADARGGPFRIEVRREQLAINKIALRHPFLPSKKLISFSQSSDFL